MSIDIETQNRWILGDSIPGVRFAMLQDVRVIAGEHIGKSGQLISIYALSPEPIFFLETADGGDTSVRQSEIQPLDATTARNLANQARMELACKSRIAIAAMAQDVLEGRVGMIEGVRKICRFRYSVGKAEAALLIPLVAFESNTEAYVLEAQRQLYSVDYLRRIDAEIGTQISDSTPAVLEACRRISERYAEVKSGNESEPSETA